MLFVQVQYLDKSLNPSVPLSTQLLVGIKQNWDCYREGCLTFHLLALDMVDE